MSDKDNNNQISKQELTAYDDYKEGFFDSYKTSRLMTNIDIKNNISVFNDVSKEHLLEYIDAVLQDSLPESDLDEFKAGVCKILDVLYVGMDAAISDIIDSTSKREDSALNQIERFNGKIELLLSRINSSVEKRSEYYQLEVDEANRVSEDAVENVKFTGGILNSLFKFTLILLTIIFAPSFFALVASATSNTILYLNTNDTGYLYWSIFLFTSSFVSVFVLFIGVNKLLKKHSYFLNLIGKSSIDKLNQSSSSATKRVDKINELVGLLKINDK